ncbi:MAG: pyridoxal phosphate-dependent aminotransferase [Rhodocyclaceae bacterium]|nr:pyridoxal phosphate-dependent aminotransferase [Rhodocyclaceae bacterium]
MKPNHGAASRMRDIAPFHVMELVARAKALEAEGRDIVHLEVGEPDFPTAAPILAAAQQFLQAGRVAYTHACGIAPLREAISAWYQHQFGVDVPPARIVITAGASGALQLALGALVSPGDEWLIPDPGYPCNRHFVRLFEGVPRAISVGADSVYQPTAAQVARHWQAATRGVMLASPSNPTGTLLPPQELAGIWNEVQGRGGALIVDEIYQGLVYDSQAATALALSDEIFVINSFSKYFGMTGWRLGWVVVPEAHLRNVEKLAQNLFICAPTVAQYAALAAFSSAALDIFEARRREFLQRRDVLIAGLRCIGFGIPIVPQGAFYVYAESSRFASDSYALAYRLLNDAGVAATPGIDFGDTNAAAHIRFAYTTDIARIEEAIARLDACLNR